MKRSIAAIIAKRYLQSFSYLTPIVRCLGVSSSEPIIDGVWIAAIDGADLGRCEFHTVIRGLIAGYLNRPELNRYKRSGEHRRLPMLPN